jgi:hypothetical protein
MRVFNKIKQQPTNNSDIDGTDWSVETVQNLTAVTRNKARLLSVIAILTIAACSSSPSNPVAGSNGNPVFAEPLVRSEDKLVPRDQATLIFVRPGTPTFTGTELPLNVYVNERFLSSLLPGGFVEHRNCPGQVEVAAVFDDARIRHLGKDGHEILVPLEAGKTYFFKVENVGTSSDVKLTPISADKVFLEEYRRQAHVLPRAPNCVNAEAAPAPTTAGMAMTAAPVVAPVSTLETNSVLAPLESWRAAWEAGDFASYSGFYAPDFKGTLKNHQEWLAFRRMRLNNLQKKVAVENLAVSTSNGTIITDFKQIYHSSKFNDDVQKRLVWKNIGGQPKIIEEIATPLK